MNIPDMTRIVKEHGCTVVPLEINPSTFNIISWEAFEKVITPKTKAVVFTHLFGVHMELDPYAEYLRKRGIDVIEDGAQGFWGHDLFNGNPNATLTMFSFGFIKIQTSIKGAVNIIRDHDLYSKMDAINQTYPVVSKNELWKQGI